MKKLLFISISLTFLAHNEAQEINIDSIEKATAELSDPAKKAEGFLDLFLEVEFTNVEKAEQYVNEAIVISENINDSSLLGRAYRQKGWLYEDNSEIPQALKSYFKSLEIYLKLHDEQNIANSYGNIGNAYEILGNFNKALENQHKSLNLNEQILSFATDSIAISRAKEGKSYALSNLSGIYKLTGDLEKAMEFQLKSLEMEKEANNIYGMAISYNTLGIFSHNLGNLEEAKKYQYKSLALSRKGGFPINISNCYLALSIVAEKEHRLNLALSYLDSAKLEIETINDLHTLSTIENNRANIYVKLNKLDKAEKIALGALKLSKEANSVDKIKLSYEVLTQVYELKKNYKRALDYYKKSIQYGDSMFNIKNKEELTRKDLEFEFANERFKDSVQNAEIQSIKDLEIQNKNYEIEKKEALIDKEKTFKIALFIGLGLLIVIALILYQGILRKKKDHQIISKQKQEVEQQRDFANRQKIIAEKQAQQLEEKNKEITDSINYAKRIQTAILPRLSTVKEYLNNSFVLYMPKDIVAGDFYWLEHKENKVFFAAADCTGHGVPGAMVSVICNNALNRSVREFNLSNPGEILDKTREFVQQEFSKSVEAVHDGMDIALCSINTSIESKYATHRKLQYAGANNPLWIVRNNELIEIPADRQPVGKYDNSKPYTTHETVLKKGDTIYIFSDGYQDQFGGEKGKKFKSANFKKLLLEINSLSMETQKEVLKSRYEEWRGDIEQIDDVCVIGMRI